MIKKKAIRNFVIALLFALSFPVIEASADIIIVESDDWFASEVTYTGIIDSGTLVLVQNCPGVFGSC
ncbi:hypothetical protein [Fodinibius halophilus]|uniref:Uncharacterized protein n=1 Tax=Fodinibius halophilus TaxID=1736908 RepID=A0A6M1T6N7_9BACT|nr:hypothetical protein [Fodinibius halophilus]NGP89769.1 hypothetical protein [Fodinibius halophilus]